MWSQNSVLTQTTKSLSSLILTTNQASCKEQHHYRSDTPIIYHSTLPTCGNISMTTGGGITSSNSVATQQKSTTSTLQSCSNIASSTSLNTLSKASTISSTARHSNGNLSTLSNNNNSTHSINNNKANSTNNISNNNNNNNEGNKNQNPNWSKLQTLEQRKLELEKLLNEKNWLLQQIHKQEAQILNGNYEQFNLFETAKGGAIILPNGGTVVSGATNSILRRKGSSSLKLSKSNVHFNGKNNRLTLSKSEYDLAQENKHNNQSTTTVQHGTGIKKRQGPPHKTNSFHDSTSASSLSLTKSPSFEYNGNNSQVGGINVGSNSGSHNIKYSISRPQHGSSENLTSNLGVTQCDKYYLSPTSQMYTDGNGFIRASQNIKQCLSPFPMHKVVALNDTEAHRTKQQLHSTSAQGRIHHNGSQPHPESYESVDALSLSPTTSFAYDQGQHMLSKHLNLWRTLSSSDRSAWCDNSSYLQLEAEGINHHSKPSIKKGSIAPTSGPSMSPESPSLGCLYPVGGLLVPTHTIEKSCDEVSISSVNSETSKKPKNKQWMESSLDGPIIRPNILQTTTPVADCNPLWPTMSPMRSQITQYSLYNMGRQPALSNEAIISGSVTPSPAPAALNTSRPPTRTLNHHAHSHHKQGYRERTKLSSQSMSSGSYRAPKTKLDDDNSHLSHSTSFLNVDAYQNNHFHLPPMPQPQQQQQSQFAHHNHYHMEMPPSGSSFTGQAQPLQNQQKPLNITMPPLCQQQTIPKASPPIQKPCDDLVGTIRYATSVATQPSRLCNPSQAITKSTLGTMQKPNPPNSLPLNNSVQLSPQANVAAATSPDIRIESPKNMTVVQQATFLPYKEVTKPFEMSDFYKYSTKFRQKEANAATMSKNPT